jgi:hypothetical protein
MYENVRDETFSHVFQSLWIRKLQIKYFQKLSNKEFCETGSGPNLVEFFQKIVQYYTICQYVLVRIDFTLWMFLSLSRCDIRM